MVYRYIVNCGELGNYQVSSPLEEIEFSKKKKAKIYDEIDHKLRSLITNMKQSILSSKLKEDW